MSALVRNDQRIEVVPREYALSSSMWMKGIFYLKIDGNESYYQFSITDSSKTESRMALPKKYIPSMEEPKMHALWSMNGIHQYYSNAVVTLVNATLPIRLT